MSKEVFPIDWLISDILAMKLEAHNIMNDKLFNYADYIEKRLLQIKKGEIELTTKSPLELKMEDEKDDD